MQSPESIAFNKENFRKLLKKTQELEKQTQELAARNAQLEKVFSELQEKHQLTQQELDFLKRQMFGRKPACRQAGASGSLLLILHRGPWNWARWPRPCWSRRPAK